MQMCSTYISASSVLAYYNSTRKALLDRDTNTPCTCLSVLSPPTSFLFLRGSYRAFLKQK